MPDLDALGGVPELARLRVLVRESGIKQADVAAEAGMTPGDLSRLLAGRKPRASIETVRRVLRAIGRRWADLDA